MKSSTIDLARIVARRHDTRTFQAACIFWGTLGLALALCTVVIAGFSLKGIAARDAQTSPQYGTATPIGRYMDTFAASPLNVYLMQANFPAAPKPPGIPGWPKPGEAYISPELARNYPVGEDSPWGRIAGVIDANSLMNLNEQSVMANPEHYTIPSARGYDITGWSDTQGFRGDHRTNKDTPQVVLLICLILVVPAIFLLVIATQLNSNTVRQQLRIFEGMGAGPSFRWKVSYFSSIAPATIALLVVAAALAIMRLSAPLYIPFAAVYLVQNDLEAATSALILTLIATLLICCGITYLNTSASSRPKAPNNADTRKPLNPYTALIMPASAFAWWLIPQFDFPIFLRALRFSP